MKSKKITAFLSALAVMAAMLVPVTVTHATETTLTVNPSSAASETNFTTVRDAVAKAKELNPQSEADRVTINIAPGNYEEQVMIEDMNYITLQQMPETTGKVNLYWHYCTGYCAGDCGLDGRYDPKVNWSDPRTWNGYNESDEKFTQYRLGQQLTKNSTKISYYDTDGTAHKDVVAKTDHLGDFVDQAALFINNKSANITIKDLNIVNSIPVMVTAGEKAVGVAPQEDRNADHATQYVLPRRDNLAICAEDTPPEETQRVKDALAIKNDVEKVKALEALTNLTAGESVYLARSDKYNERGHAIAFNGDRIIAENIRVRGNQDSVWVGTGRMYFKNCDLIGGTDYIYGDASVVFDSCKLGAVGMSNKDYGATITAANHDAKNPYGYLFYNCEVYNVLSNITNSCYGRPWRSAAQITFFNTLLDDTAVTGASPAGISAAGWNGMSGNEANLARFYEFGTKTRSGAAVDTSKRVVNATVEEGGQGMGTVLDKWQILEFNPRNYFNNEFQTSNGRDFWDPMNFSAILTEIDSEIEAATITVPAGKETEIALPVPTDNNIEYHWVSASANAVVSNDGTKMTVVRPALGEAAIESSVILYARNKTTGFGDKKEIPVTINATTDTTKVFNIPVTISQSLAAENEYTVTISKDGALIKEQVIPVSETTTQVTIENIPASASGINYDVTVVSKSNDFTLVSPEDGKTTINGVTVTDVPLNITASKVIDETIDLDIDYSSSDGNKSYDLIALAKAKGASNDISKSEVITLNYTLTTKQDDGTSGKSFIDLLSAAPEQSLNTNGNTSRFVLAKLGHWNQLDFVDSTQSYSGSSNNDHQHLNMCGKFANGTPSNVTVTIDYKNQTIAVSGEGTKSDSFTFTTFPQTYEKGKLYMGVYSGGEVFDINNISVTYKSEVTGDRPEPTEVPLPSGVGTYVFPADRNHVTNGNQCDNDDTFVLLDTADARLAEILKDKTDSTKLNAEYIGHYLNYISGTNEGGSHPKITLSAPAGYYTVYLVGYNNDNKVKVIVDGETYYAEEGVQFAAKESNTSYVLKSYKIDVKVKKNNDTITFDSDNSWLPDSYVFVVDAKEAPPMPTSAPTNVPTNAPTGKPSESTKPAATENPVVTTPSPTPDTDNPSVTEAPAKAGIEKAIVKGGNTQVYLNNIMEGVVIAAKYENGVMTAVKTAEIPQVTVQAADPAEIVIEGFEADKIMVWNSIKDMKPLCDSKATVKNLETPTPMHTSIPTPKPAVTPIPTLIPTPIPTQRPDAKAIEIDFTAMSAVPVYSAAMGQGFIEQSDAIMPRGSKRQVAPASAITISSEGAKVTESSGSYLHKKNNSNDGDDDNNGGLIYRVDTGVPGAYHIEVEVTGSSADTLVAPTGMQASRITGTGAWDTAGLVAHTVYASWEGSRWSYDFATGEDFVEIEIEPKTLATASAPQTVGVKSIKITPLAPNTAGDKPTIHILGDSTQKTYTFNETISAWGQVLGNYFDSDKVNVRNYSMGGRAMKSNYNEGRFGEILINGKTGDYVFIHSAHNDETISTNRFSRGAGSVKDDLAANNENYNKWLDMYVSAIKARGMTPVLVTAMPRTGSGKYSESTLKPNGFNPDSPANMRAKAASDDGVGLAELYEGAKEYIDKLDAKEVNFIYNSYEAGESPANSAANGTNGDGTHYREAASKQWSRIILQSIYDQSLAETDTYKDKPIMQKLVNLMDADVQAAAQSGDWSAVFPEVASDVSAVDIVPGAQKQAEANYYYRNNIEKALQLGLLHKDTDNLFKPTQTITVGEFARGAEKAFGLEANSLTNYTKTYAELSAASEASAFAASIEAPAGDADVSLMTEGDITVTVEQPEGGTVTVYNNSAFKTATADITDNVEASSVISDNNYFTLTAPAAVTKKSDSNIGFDNKAITRNGIETRDADDGKGDKEIIYTAKATGVLTVYMRHDNTKTITLEDQTTGVRSDKYIEGEKAEIRNTSAYGAVDYNVTEGTTYHILTKGGTGILFGVKYASTDYPQSTTSLAVNSGDEIRVVAAPNENYVNKSIKLNGEVKATSKEYIFNATADTTVTAEFEAEPALVETTRVASDAALTREVMGAILYDAYKAAEAKHSGETGGIWSNIQTYIGQNGSIPSPDDPSYDPNIQYEGTPYIPLTGWGMLTDKSGLNNALYGKVKAAYNLGLIRCEDGAARGTIKNGTKLEPTAEVTRAKAAKSLVFAFLLTQSPKGESQTIPEGFAVETPSAIEVPNANALSTVFGE